MGRGEDMLPDVVVVGAGPTGLMVALALRREGLQVTVVDEGQPLAHRRESGSTVLAPLASRPMPLAWVRLGVDGLARWEAWAAEWPGLGRALGPERGLVALPYEAGAWTAVKGLAAAAEIRAEPLDDIGIRRLVPGLIGQAGLFYPDWRTILPSMAYAVLLDAVLGQGVTVHFESMALGVELRGRRVRGVRLPGRVVPGGIVVVAAGAASARLMDTLGRARPMGVAVRSVMRLTPRRLWPHPVSGAGIWAVPSPLGDLSLSDDGQRGSASILSVDRMTAVLTSAVRLHPDLTQAGLVDWTTVSYAVSPDGLPVWGWWPELDGLLLASGFGAQTWLVGPLMADATAALIQQVPVPLDLHPFRPERA